MSVPPRKRGFNDFRVVSQLALATSGFMGWKVQTETQLTPGVLPPPWVDPHPLISRQNARDGPPGLRRGLPGISAPYPLALVSSARATSARYRGGCPCERIRAHG